MADCAAILSGHLRRLPFALALKVVPRQPVEGTLGRFNLEFEDGRSAPHSICTKGGYVYLSPHVV